MELVSGVSLQNYVKTKIDRKVDEKEGKDIYYQIINGMDYLHQNNIIHRDLKLENIIIDDKKNIKIIDFGFGTISSDETYSSFFCGTPSYMPPEIVSKKDYIGKEISYTLLLGSYADVWTLGVLLYIMLCGTFPFRALTEKELYKKIVKGIFTVPDNLSCEANKLIKMILIVDHKIRPTCFKVIRKNNNRF